MAAERLGLARGGGREGEGGFVWEGSEFSAILNVLLGGDDGEVNEVRAVQLLADRGGDNVSSRPSARRYGFSSHSRVPTGARTRASPLADRSSLEDGDDDR